MGPGTFVPHVVPRSLLASSSLRSLFLARSSLHSSFLTTLLSDGRRERIDSDRTARIRSSNVGIHFNGRDSKLLRLRIEDLDRIWDRHVLRIKETIDTRERVSFCEEEGYEVERCRAEDACRSGNLSGMGGRSSSWGGTCRSGRSRERV